jgi:transposase InsO family protein
MRDHRDEFPVAVMCRVLEVSRSGYYAWLGRSESGRERANRGLLVKIRAAHARSRKTYGSPRVWRELRASGERCGRNRVARLMRAHGVVGVRRPKFRTTTDSRHALPVAANLLERRFGVSEANRVWVSDLSCVWTWEGWLYIAPVLDLWSRRVVGWATGASPDRRLVVRALETAIGRRRPKPGLLFHSDRGSQYAAGDVQELLRKHKMVASMSRKGDCWDNAPAESFFATLKSELVHRRRYRTRAEAKRDLFEYIERFYNTERRHSALEYRSPAEFEACASTNIIHQSVH